MTSSDNPESSADDLAVAPEPLTDARAAEESSATSWSVFAFGTVLLLLALGAYAPVLRAGFIWDDDAYVTQNPTLRTFRGLGQMWFVPNSLPQYYPLVHTTYWIEYHLWGLDPRGYHVINVLLHATSAILCWRVLRRLQVPGAWVAAALFAVHPVTVESVAWVTERKNVLSLVLALASLLCYLRFAPAEAEASEIDRRRGGDRWRWYVWSLAFFIAALFTKTVVASLPAVLLVIYWWKRGRIARADALPLLPFFALGAAAGLYTAWLERTHVGASGDRFAFTPVDRVLIAGRALWFYAGKLLCPYPLMFFYPRWNIKEHSAAAFLYPAAALGVMILLWLARKRIGRGPLAAVLIFAGVLMPALGFLNVYPFRYSFVADHFQYHACLALLALAAAAATVALRPLRDSLGGLLNAAVAAAIVLLLAAMTFRQTWVYEDVETLYGDTLAKNPNCVIALANLGLHLNELGRNDEALPLVEKAVALDPSEPAAHADLGVVLLSRGNRQGFKPGEMENAVAHLEECLRLDPSYVSAYHNLAYVMIVTGKPTEAMKLFERVLEISPRDARALYGMGKMLESQKRPSEAESYYQRAVERDPELVPARLALAAPLLERGRLDEAIAHLTAALQLDPKSADAHFALGTALLQRGDLAGAAEQFQVAVRLRPNFAPAIVNLGIVLINLNRIDDAIHSFEDALRQNPQSINAHYGMATALVKKGDIPAAIEQYSAILAANPRHVEAHYELGTLLAARGELQPAIEHFAAAVQLRPIYFEALRDLGSAELDSGNAAAAVKHLTEALRVRPDDTQTKAKLAQAQQGQSDPSPK